MSRFDTDITERLRWDKRYTLGHVPVTLEDAAAEVERLRAENERLRAALRPFAALLDGYETECGKAGRVILWQEWLSDYRWPLEQQCIDARAALGINEQNVEETKT